MANSPTFSRYRRKIVYFITHREPTSTVNLISLISPLRYDIIIRLEYYRFFEHNIGIYNSDFASYCALARKHPYYDWFTQIPLPRKQPNALKDPELVNTYFAKRLRDAARLYESFNRDGFDSSRPIILHTGKNIRETASGKILQQSLFPGRGCHRIALLSLNGITSLEPSMYRIKAWKAYIPVDNTARLLASRTLPAKRYFEFIALRYSDRTVADPEQFIRELAATDSPCGNEVRQILEADRKWLT